MPVLAPSRRGGKRLAKKAKRKQEALHDLVQICVLLLVVVLICTFWNVSDSLADPELETDISGFGQQSSQSQFIASYTRAREQEQLTETFRKQIVHSEYSVTGSGYDNVDLRLSAFNMLAYHWDALEEAVRTAFPDSQPVEFPDDIDMEVFALAVMGTSLDESGSTGTVDKPESGNNWGNMQQEWQSFTDEQKIEALLDPQFMNKPLSDGPWQDGRPNRWDGYLPGNCAAGKWGYGLYQWTAGRREVLGTLWRDTDYNLSTIDGQMVMIAAEAMGTSISSSWRPEYKHMFAQMTKSNFPNGIYGDNYPYSISIFWGSCVYGNNRITYEKAVNGSFSARNGNLTNTKWAVNGHVWLEIYRTFATDGVEGVRLLLAS